MGRLLLLGLLSAGGPAFAAALRTASARRDEPSLAAEAPKNASAAAAPAAGAAVKAKGAKPVNGPKVHTNWDLYATPESKKRATMLIPKVLHQTYKGMQLPPKFKQYRDTWVKNLPGDWALRLWTEQDLRSLIKEKYPWFLEVYDSYEQDINRIYAARVFLMHQYGGVYADLDVEALFDPTPLFSGDYDLAFFYSKMPKFRRPWAIDKTKGNAMGVISNALMASVSKHPFWLFLAQRMMKAAKDAGASRGQLYSTGDAGASKQKDVLFTTGSSLLTDVLSDFQEKFPDAVVGVFGNRYWSPWKLGARDEICEGREACTILHPDALLVHHWTGCWNHCTPGTCLAKAEEVVPKKMRKRVMPAPPMLPDAPAATPPPPLSLSASEAPAAAQGMMPPPPPEEDEGLS